MAEPTPQPKVSSPLDPAGQLRQLWDEGPPPDVSAFLQRVGPLSPIQLGAVLRADQRGRWRAGERVLAEDYLRRFPAVLENAETALDLIFNEFLLREEC